MIELNWRKFLTLAVALALVIPPISGTVNKALGGDGTHVHFEHVWHAAGVDDVADHHHGDRVSADQGDVPCDSHCDHVHIATMLGMTTYGLNDVAIVRTYQPQPIFQQPGLSLSPPGHPPQALS